MPPQRASLGPGRIEAGHGGGGEHVLPVVKVVVVQLPAGPVLRGQADQRGPGAVVIEQVGRLPVEPVLQHALRAPRPAARAPRSRPPARPARPAGPPAAATCRSSRCPRVPSRPLGNRSSARAAAPHLGGERRRPRSRLPSARAGQHGQHAAERQPGLEAVGGQQLHRPARGGIAGAGQVAAEVLPLVRVQRHQRRGLQRRAGVALDGLQGEGRAQLGALAIVAARTPAPR